MHPILNKLIQGMIFGVGVLFVLSVAGIVGITQFTSHGLKDIIYKVQEKTDTATVVEPFAEPVSVIKDFSNADRIFVSNLTPSSTVSNVQELKVALSEANKKGNYVIYLEDGIYHIDRTLYIKKSHISMISKSGNPYKTVIKGKGMTSKIGNIVRVNASDFRMDGITLTDASYHLVQIAGENDADNTEFRNMIFQDSYQQLIKVSFNGNRNNATGDNGKIINSIFQYTKGIAPNWYTGGIDVLGGKGWKIRDNIFRDIASPSQRIAQFGVHFWKTASDNHVIGNVFINNDRAIGFGLGNVEFDDLIPFNSQGGAIKNNIIFHSDQADPYADAGIVLEQSPDTEVLNNLIFMTHDYPNAIEYRFPATRGVIISQNGVNRTIRERDGGSAIESKNYAIEETSFIANLTRRLDQLSISKIY